MANNTIVRGDTFAFKFRITFADETPVASSDVATLLITFKASTRTESKVIFQKTKEDVIIDGDGYCHAVFIPEDTQSLMYGTYYYDCEVTLTDGYRKTIVNTLTLSGETSVHGGTNNV